MSDHHTTRPGFVPPGQPTNALLATLDVSELERIRPRLRRVPLTFKQVLIRQGERVRQVWFPAGGICSLVRHLEDGAAIEIATIGREGLIGGTAFFGETEAVGEAVIQVPNGHAYTMPLDLFAEVLARQTAFCDRVMAFEHALTVMVMQSAACNGVHEVEPRLARWLLICHDRVGQDSFTITQEFLAMMLAVRRPSVTASMGALQSQGAIAHARRRVTIVNRHVLEQLACECYSVIRAEFDRLLA